MAVGGDDDTVAGSLPTFTGVVTPVGENELIAGRYRILERLAALAGQPGADSAASMKKASSR